MRTAILTVCLLLLFFLPVAISAHGTGYSFEQESGNFLIDIGADRQPVRENEPVRFDFLLFDKDTKTPRPFTDLWVRIADEKQTIFAGGIPKARLGTTGVTYTFPAKGLHTFSVRFQENETVLTETSFSVLVSDLSNTSIPWNLIVPLGTGIAGLAIGFVGSVLRRKKLLA